MIRTPEQAGRYVNEAPNDLEAARRRREVFAEQQSILARRASHADENGRVDEQALAAELDAERAKADRLQ